MAWAKNGTPNTLGSAGDDLDITDLTAKKFNVFLYHKLYSTDTRTRQTFNNNSNTVYAKRQSYRGGADTTATSQAYLEINLDAAADELHIQYVNSISGEEKLVIGFGITNATAGASTAPDRLEYVGKFVPSPDADITRIDMNNYGTGDFATGSNLSAIGTD